MKKSIERFKELLATTADDTKTKDLSKKDLAGMTRAIERRASAGNHSGRVSLRGPK